MGTTKLEVDKATYCAMCDSKYKNHNTYRAHLTKHRKFDTFVLLLYTVKNKKAGLTKMIMAKPALYATKKELQEEEEMKQLSLLDLLYN